MKNCPYSETAGEIVNFINKEHLELRQNYENSVNDLESVAISNQFIKQKLMSSHHHLDERQKQIATAIEEELKRAFAKTDTRLTLQLTSMDKA